MKNSEKIQEIQNILVEIYGETLTSSQRGELVDDIYDCAFTDDYDLVDIIMVLSEMEEEDDGKAMDVFHAVVFLMDNNMRTAKKLFRCFLENIEDLDVLCKLLNWNSEWLSPKEKLTIKEAAKCFDYETLKCCIWNWDEV